METRGESHSSQASDVGDHGEIVRLGQGRHLHAGEYASANRRVRLENVRSAMMHHVPESGQGENALAHRDTDRRLRPELGECPDHVLGKGFLVEAHVVRLHPPRQADRLAERVCPVAVSHQMAVVADDAPGPGDQLKIPIRVVAQPHFDASDPDVEDIIEIRLVPAEVRIERSRPRGVQRQTVHAGAEYRRERHTVLLTEYVPQSDLDGADDLRGDAVPSQVAVQP